MRKNDINSNRQFYGFDIPTETNLLLAFEKGQYAEDYEPVTPQEQRHYQLGLAFGAGYNGEDLGEVGNDAEIKDAFAAGKARAKEDKEKADKAKKCPLCETKDNFVKEVTEWAKGVKKWAKKLFGMEDEAVKPLNEMPKVENTNLQPSDLPDTSKFENANPFVEKFKKMLPTSFRNATGNETLRVLGIGAGLMFLFMYKERIFGFFNDVTDASRKAVR